MENWMSCTPHLRRFTRNQQGSAIVEFAIALPLLVVFVVGIYDFSAAFDTKQKISQAAQEGAILAGSQPMNDIQSIAGSNPPSLQAVVTAVFNSLVASGALPAPQSCVTGNPPTGPVGLTWTYTISGCSTAHSSDNLIITINRGWVSPGTSGVSTNPDAVGTTVQVVFPYHWQFNTVIQLLIPGANYSAMTYLTENATVQNQL
jgi:Flp pilus assembly protein TadG